MGLNKKDRIDDLFAPKTPEKEYCGLSDEFDANSCTHVNKIPFVEYNNLQMLHNQSFWGQIPIYDISVTSADFNDPEQSMQNISGASTSEYNIFGVYEAHPQSTIEFFQSKLSNQDQPLFDTMASSISVLSSDSRTYKNGENGYSSEEDDRSIMNALQDAFMKQQNELKLTEANNQEEAFDWETTPIFDF